MTETERRGWGDKTEQDGEELTQGREDTLSDLLQGDYRWYVDWAYIKWVYTYHFVSSERTMGVMGENVNHTSPLSFLQAEVGFCLTIAQGIQGNP